MLMEGGIPEKIERNCPAEQCKCKLAGSTVCFEPAENSGFMHLGVNRVLCWETGEKNNQVYE